MKAKFTKNNLLNDNEIAILHEFDFADGSPMLEAWCNEGPYATVTIFVPDHLCEPGWVNIHHDVINCNGYDGLDFLGSFLDAFVEEKKEISYGYARSLQVKLKDGWENMVIDTREVQS